MKGLTHQQSREMWERMREYKAEGHTMKEVADRFGVSKQYAQSKCKGIAPQIARPAEYKNKYTGGNFDREENAKRYIRERTPGFEYAGNFTGLDGYVDLRCKSCGAVVRKSFVSVKHGTATCQQCMADQLDLKRRKKEAERRSRDIIRARNRFRTATVKGHQLGMAECKCCGALFVRNRTAVFCSDACAKRMVNARNKDKRVRKIRGAMVDRDIRIERLFDRDGGVCALCGEACDWLDYETREDGTIIAGNRYPSIDHIVPLSRGGLHAWDNVQLAHRECNIRKRDYYTPPV